MKLIFGYIYKITNLVNNKIYIGQTIHTLKYRFNQHINQNKCTKLHNAIVKYGKENFIIEEIEKVPQSLLDEREIYWIDFYASTDRIVGYNILKGGKLGPLGKYKLTSEQIKEIVKLDSEKVSHIEIGKMFGINRKTVTFILRRELDYIPKRIKLEDRTDLEDIKKFLYENNPTSKEVKEKFGIGQSNLFRYTKSIGYKFLTYRERQKLEYNSPTSVRTLPSNVGG